MKPLVYGDKGDNVVFLQRALNEKLGIRLKTDGDFGRMVASAVDQLQDKLGLPEEKSNGFSCCGPEMLKVVEPFIKAKYITDDSYKTIGEETGIPAYLLNAITLNESKSSGFLDDGRVVILFERHKYYSFLAEKGQSIADSFSTKNPDICNKKSGGYVGYEGEYPRYTRAKAFSLEAANRATSFGLFQQMGFNYAASGYASATEMAAGMQASETNQLRAIARFIKNDTKMYKALIGLDLAAFSERYNGPNYKQHKYDTRLAANIPLAKKELATS